MADFGKYGKPSYWDNSWGTRTDPSAFAQGATSGGLYTRYFYCAYSSWWIHNPHCAFTLTGRYYYATSVRQATQLDKVSPFGDVTTYYYYAPENYIVNHSSDGPRGGNYWFLDGHASWLNLGDLRPNDEGNNYQRCLMPKYGLDGCL